MLYRHIAVAVLAFFLTGPLLAFGRGEVLIEERKHSPAYGIPPGHNFWVYFGGKYAFRTGLPLIYKPIPYGGAGRFLMPSPNQILFHSRQTVSVWDGKYQIYTIPGLGYTEIFTRDTELSEIAPMRSGNFLVAERSAERGRGAKLIEFNLQGVVAEYDFPEVVLMPLTTNRVLGAMHIELLADQCTVLYTLGSDDLMLHSVRRLNICTNQPQTDFATLPASAYAGAIRQLPDGDVLVANGNAILRFDVHGSLRRTHHVPGVTHVALAPEGTAFWAAGVHLEKTFLLRFELATPTTEPESIMLENPGSQTIMVPIDVTELNVVGEWRSSMPRARGRVVRR